MALHIITVVLFTAFVSEALTLTCFNCTSTPPATCTSTANCSHCSSMTTIVGSSNVDVKSCDTGSCVNLTINSALIKISSKCCSSDYCNNATDSENGLSCDGTGGTLKCKVGENQCFTVTAGFNGMNLTLKGCASQNICNSTLRNITPPPGVNIFNFSCLHEAKNMTQGPVSAGTSTFFHLKSVLGGFLLVLVFRCSVLST